MKRIQLHILTILFISLTVFTSCSKKERDPQLIVTVTDADGVPLKGATVHVWPTDQLVIDPTSSGEYNELMDKTEFTDGNGEAAFYFYFSAVLDVDVEYTLATSDTTSSLLEGHKVVKIETIEQKDANNFFYETVIAE
jgi:hypothetical protein